MDKGELAQLYNTQRVKHDQRKSVYKHKISTIQKQCAITCETGETSRVKDLEKAKIKKIRDETKPNLEEEMKFKEELELVWKNNPMYK